MTQIHPSNYRVRLEYMPPIRPDWWLFDDPEMKVTAMVSYWKADPNSHDGVIPSSSYTLYWPPNPWHELEIQSDLDRSSQT